MRWWDRIF
jgi:hypothetical protein